MSGSEGRVHVVDRLLPLPVGEGELRYGFMVSDVNRITVMAVRKYRGYSPALFPHQVEVAYHAIVEHLYSCEEKPGVYELAAVAWRVLTSQFAKDVRFKGLNPAAVSEGVTGGFARYWLDGAASSEGLEEGVVERLAPGQIMPMLKPRSQRVLMALAEFDDYGLAAEAVGVSRSAFPALVSFARREFLEWWHEGELPSVPWAQDRRKDPGAKTRASGTEVIRRRRRARELRPAGLPPVRRGGGGRRPMDLGVGVEELGRRYLAGETIKEIADSLGVGAMTVHKRLVKAGVPRRARGSRLPASAGEQAEVTDSG